MQTRKYPRTMQEAFGPHVSDELHPMPSEKHRDGIVSVACVLALAVLGFLAMIGALPGQGV